MLRYVHMRTFYLIQVSATIRSKTLQLRGDDVRGPVIGSLLLSRSCGIQETTTCNSVNHGVPLGRVECNVEATVFAVRDQVYLHCVSRLAHVLNEFLQTH